MGCVEESKKAEWIRTAEGLKPALFVKEVHPTGRSTELPLKEGDSVVFDFGNHYVGQVKFRFSHVGSHPDAPTYLRIKFCETSRELDADTEHYQGWISKGWIQEEFLHMDILPMEFELPRRYAFRYVRVEVMAVSAKYSLVIDDVAAFTTTSADDAGVKSFEGNALETRLDEISLRTLRSCMQDVFEDGPKRDRRLWIGDLRLQALVNYETYKKNDLVKRCLYLFAGVTDADGRVPACLFTEPKIEGDDTYMFDYSLFYIAALWDYCRATGDIQTGRELLPVAVRQWELSRERFDARHLIMDSDVMGWCFLDWNLNLNKQAGAQAVYIYCAKALLELLKMCGEKSLADNAYTDESESEKEDSMGNNGLHSYGMSSLAEPLISDTKQDLPISDTEKDMADTQCMEKLQLKSELMQDIAEKTDAMKNWLYDEEEGLFFSGAKRQYSYASQAWAVLAGVVEGNDALELLNRIQQKLDAQKMVTPYMYHNFIEALILAGDRRQAYRCMTDYWGAMAADGADTFYELFNPENPDESPYGSPVVNSYCHAWSCTPAYFMRHYGLTEAAGDAEQAVCTCEANEICA